MVVRNFLKLMSNSKNEDKIAIIKLIINSGIGIPEDEEKRLLEYFHGIQDETK